MKRPGPGGFLFYRHQTGVHMSSFGRGAKSKGVGVSQSKWQVRASHRLAQLRKPGIYPLSLIVSPDGSRQLVVENGKVEDLGE